MLPAFCPLRVAAMCVLAAAVLVSCAGCAHRPCLMYELQGHASSKVYLYRLDYIERCLSELDPLGRGDTFSRFPEKDSRGTCLHFHSDEEQAVLIVKNDGEVFRLNKPAFRASLNDEEEFVVWSDACSRDFSFKGGLTRTAMDTSILVDPGGRFFCITTPEGVVELARIEQPTTPLVRLDCGPWDPTALFATSGRLYVLTRSCDEHTVGGVRTRKVLDMGIECLPYRVEAENIFAEPAITISRARAKASGGVGVRDMDPDSHTVLLCDSFEMPMSFRSAYYVFDLDSGARSRVGPIGAPLGRVGLLLADDILGNALARKRRGR